MQPMFQIRNLQLRKIDSIDTICQLAKDFKDPIIGVTPGFLYSTNVEGCIYKRTSGVIDTPTFIFSVNQLKTNSAKALLADPSNAYMHNELIIRSEDRDIIDSGSYYIDATSQDVLEINTGRLIPCIKTGSKDQFFEYHNKFDYRFDYALQAMTHFDLYLYIDVPGAKDEFEVFTDFQEYDVFKDMIDKKKEWGSFRAQFKSPNSDMIYIATFYKNMIPFKKGDRVSAVFTKAYPEDPYYDAMFVIERKKHAPITTYCRYLNLLK